MESLHIFVNSLRKMNDLGRDTKLIVVVLYKVFSKKDTGKCKFCSSVQGIDFCSSFDKRIMMHTHRALKLDLNRKGTLILDGSFRPKRAAEFPKGQV